MKANHLMTSLLFLILIFISSGCKKECTENCSTNASCVRGSCECDDSNMIKIFKPNPSHLSIIRCMPKYLYESAYTYRPIHNNCMCADDILLFFIHCNPNSSGGLIAPCRSSIYYKDFEVNMYRDGVIDIDAFLPTGQGQGDREVYVEFGIRTGTGVEFCLGDEDTAGVVFRGTASEDLDTLHLNMLYLNGDYEPARDSCAVSLLRVKKED